MFCYRYVIKDDPPGTYRLTIKRCMPEDAGVVKCTIGEFIETRAKLIVKTGINYISYILNIFHISAR